MAEKWTHQEIAGLKGTGEAYEVRDHGEGFVRGLYIRVNPKGDVKSWYFEGRVRGDKHTTAHLIGRFPGFGLAEARTEAKAMLKLMQRGTNPTKERDRLEEEGIKQARATELANIEAQERTVAKLVDRYWKEWTVGLSADDTTVPEPTPSLPKGVKPRLRRHWDIYLLLKRTFVKELGNRDTKTLRSNDARTLLKGVRMVQGPKKGEHSQAIEYALFGALVGFQNWCLNADAHPPNYEPLIEIPFMLGLQKVEANHRERPLSDDELRVLWRVARDKLGFPHGPCIQLLLLTAQREAAVGDLPPGELHHLDTPNEAHWWLPFERRKARNNQKNKKAHFTGLTEPARRILASAQCQVVDDGVHIFSGASSHTKKKRGGVTGWDHVKERTIQLMEHEFGGPINPEAQPWRWHDIRHTIRTKISTGVFRIPADIKEMVINHRAPAYYDHYEHQDEMRAVLDIWWQYLMNIVTSPYGSAPEVPKTDYFKELERIRKTRDEKRRPLTGLPNPDPLVPKDPSWVDLHAKFCVNPNCGKLYFRDESTARMDLMYCSQVCQDPDIAKRHRKDAAPRVCANPECPRNGEPFTPGKPDAEYCTRECYMRHYYLMKTKPVNDAKPKTVHAPRVCQNIGCGKTYVPKHKNARFCSRKCIDENHDRRRRVPVEQLTRAPRSREKARLEAEWLSKRGGA
jgi:hypothetical protein